MIVRRLWWMVLAACLAVNGPSWGESSSAPGQREQEREASESDPGRRQESRLVLKSPVAMRNRIFRFPVEFTAAPGETVGTIRLQVTFLEGAWKYRRFDSPPGSRLKVSAKTAQRGSGIEGRAVVELTISAGTHVIKDGVIGSLQLAWLRQEGPPADWPAAQLVITAPPETEQITEFPEKPFELPPEPALNPSTACFFFSH